MFKSDIDLFGTTKWSSLEQGTTKWSSLEQGTTKWSSLEQGTTKWSSLEQGTTKWSSLTLVKELGQSKSLQLHAALLGLDSLAQGIDVDISPSFPLRGNARACEGRFTGEAWEPKK